MQRHFNEIYSKMHILVENRIIKLCFKLLNDLDELNFTQHNNRRDNFESIHKKNQYVFSANFSQNNFKDLKDFSKPYIFITTLSRRHYVLTSENPKL